MKRCKWVTCDMHFSRLPGKQERYCGIIPGNQILARNRDNLEGSCSSVAFSYVVLEVFNGDSGSFMVSIREIWWKKYSVDFSRRLWDFVIFCFRLLYAFFTWDRLTTFAPWQEDFSRQFAELRTELQQRNRHHSCNRFPQPGHLKVKSCQTFASMIWETDSLSPRFFQTFLFGHRHCDIPCVGNGRSIYFFVSYHLVRSQVLGNAWNGQQFEQCNFKGDHNAEWSPSEKNGQWVTWFCSGHWFPWKGQSKRIDTNLAWTSCASEDTPGSWGFWT